MFFSIARFVTIRRGSYVTFADKETVWFQRIPGLLLQVNLWDMVGQATPLTFGVLLILLIFSIFSWTIIFAKWSAFRRARRADCQIPARIPQSERPGCGDGGERAVSSRRRWSRFSISAYDEVTRQVKSRGTVNNKVALERTLQLGTSEELAKLERNMSWLATTASVSPFIGLFGTVLGIIRSFQQLGAQGSSSLRAVGPGISEALIATAVGLFAAIPAAIAL